MKFRDMNAVEKAEYLNDKFFEIDGKLYHRELDHHTKGFGPVGSKSKRGYLRVRIDENKELVHRIIFAMMHGYWPENSVDHIHGTIDDNRIENLQEVSGSCNISKGDWKAGKSGYRGIRQTHSGKWIAAMCFNGKPVYAKYRPKRLQSLADWCDMINAKLGDSACMTPQFIRIFKLVERAHRLFGDNRIGAWYDKQKYNRKGARK